MVTFAFASTVYLCCLFLAYVAHKLMSKKTKEAKKTVKHQDQTENDSDLEESEVELAPETNRVSARAENPDLRNRSITKKCQDTQEPKGKKETKTKTAGAQGPSEKQQEGPLQIIEINKETVDGKIKTSYVLKETLLKSILNQQDFADKEVAVISVAGPSREGKSFLLNFILLFLQHLEQGHIGKTSDWWDPKQKLTGFSWTNSSKPETTGILMWSRPFLITRGESKMAVLLMDTEGSFDLNSTIKDCATVFALSTMISSLQSLLFLIKDWQFPDDHSFGFKGGMDYLATQKLNLKSTSAHRNFTKIRCFLMPYPGDKVASTKQFSGKVEDIGENFMKQLKLLVPGVVSDELLPVKEINGQTIKCKDLFNYFKTYTEAFSQGTLPTPMNIAEANAEASQRNAFEAAYNLYETKMKEICSGPYVDEQALADEHLLQKTASINEFKESPKMGDVLDEYSEKKLQEKIKVQSRPSCVILSSPLYHY